MKKVAIYPYKPYSKSCKLLAEALQIKRIKHENSRFNARNKTVINWGSRTLPDLCAAASVVINSPAVLERVGDKYKAFEQMSEFNIRNRDGVSVNIPYYTRNLSFAISYMRDNGVAMMERHTLTGHSGEGIVYCEHSHDLDDAPMYVEYIKKSAEYRVHFVGDHYFVQRKARKMDVVDEDVNWKVRNLTGGFIYASDEENVGDIPENVLEQANLVRQVTGLDFGAIDLIYNKKRKKAYFLEVNTAPGLVGRTLEFYTEKLPQLIDEKKAG